MTMRWIAWGASLLLAGCVAATPTYVSVDTYDISGRNIAELMAATDRHGPMIQRMNARAFAAVVPSFYSTFEQRQIGDTCRYNPGGRIILRTNVEIPRWRERATTSSSLGDQWDAIRDFAIRHELVHIAIFQRYTRKLETLHRTLEGSTCEELDERLRKAEARLWEEQSAEHDRFDAYDYVRFSLFIDGLLNASQ